MNMVGNVKTGAKQRFESDENMIVKFSVSNEITGSSIISNKMSFEHIGLAYNESFYGVGAIFVTKIKVNIGDKCILQVGELNPVVAEIRWFKSIDKSVLKIGFELLE